MGYRIILHKSPAKAFISHLNRSFLFSIGCLSFAYAQAPDTLWTKAYGGYDEEIGYSVQETADGGYILAGYTRSFGPELTNAWLVKTDASGDTLWTKVYGGDSTEGFHSVFQTANGGYIVGGSTRSFGAGGGDFWLVKTDDSGDTIWTRTYGGEERESCYSMQPTFDGGYVMVGITESYGMGTPGDLYLVKTDSLGDILWTRAFGGDLLDYCEFVSQTVDSGYVMTGIYDFIGGSTGDIWVLKTDSQGDTLWTRKFGGNSTDRGHAIQETSDGYIIVASTWSFGAGSWDLYLIKTDLNGDTVWTKLYGGVESDGGMSIQRTFDGAYIITGSTYSFSTGGLSDVWLLKIDALGDTLWTSTFGGSSFDSGYFIQQTSDSGYIVVGSTHSYGAGSSDFYLIKTARDVSIHEQKTSNITRPYCSATILSGPLVLPENTKCEVFDITGRSVHPANIKPGIYFVVVEGSIIHKVVMIE